jgi:prophage antirepressor-like protein
MPPFAGGLRYFPFFKSITEVFSNLNSDRKGLKIMCSNQVKNITSNENIAIYGCAGCVAPFWSAADICKLLEFENSDQVIDDLDPDLKEERFLKSIQDEAMGSKVRNLPKKVKLVNIEGFLSLMLRSQSSIAKKFQRWVVGDVLFEILAGGGSARNIDFSIIEELEEMGLLPVGN